MHGDDRRRAPGRTLLSYPNPLRPGKIARTVVSNLLKDGSWLARHHRLPARLDFDGDPDLLAEHGAAGVQDAVPGHAIVLPVDGERHLEAGLLAVRSPDRPEDRHRN